MKMHIALCSMKISFLLNRKNYFFRDYRRTFTSLRATRPTQPAVRLKLDRILTTSVSHGPQQPYSTPDGLTFILCSQLSLMAGFWMTVNRGQWTPTWTIRRPVMFSLSAHDCKLNDQTHRVFVVHDEHVLYAEQSILTSFLASDHPTSAHTCLKKNTFQTFSNYGRTPIQAG